jgi:hypothetical protein
VFHALRKICVVFLGGKNDQGGCAPRASSGARIMELWAPVTSSGTWPATFYDLADESLWIRFALHCDSINWLFDNKYCN